MIRFFFSEKDFQSPADSALLKEIQNLTGDAELAMLLGIIYIGSAKGSLEMLSFRLFMTEKPKQPEKPKVSQPIIIQPFTEIVLTFIFKNIVVSHFLGLFWLQIYEKFMDF